MSSVVELLTDKNTCLEKFFKLNEAELESLSAGNFEGLETFYQSRDGILEIIRKIDEMIERSHDEVGGVREDDLALRDGIIEALDYKQNLVTKILEQDLEILSLVENKKSNIIKELNQIKSTKKIMSSYKSGSKKSRLDEKA